MTVTWNPSDKDAGLVLSGGNLTAGNSSGANASVRATLAIITGEQRFYSLHIDSDGGSYGTLFGVCNISQGLGTGVFIGSTANGCGIGPDGQVFINFVNVGTGPTWTTGDVIDMRVNRNGVKTIAFRKNGGAWSSDLDISSITGDLYPATTVSFVGDQVTANFGASALPYALPANYIAWDVELMAQAAL